MSDINESVVAINGLPFHKRLAFVKQVNETSFHRINYYTTSLSYRGYLVDVAEKAVQCNEGEHYVYLWRHAWGEPFYVGRGTGDRWLCKNDRCDDFFPHIDKGDAVPYLVLCGVDAKTAREYERYVSVNLVRAGYTLVNSDNNPARNNRIDWDKVYGKLALLENNELTSKVRSSVEKILCHDPKCDYRVTENFLRFYGNDYFSRNFGKRRNENAYKTGGT